MKNQPDKKILITSLSSIVFSFTIFFFSPLGLFFTQIDQWSIRKSSAIFLLFLLSIFSSTLLTLFLLQFRSENSFFRSRTIVVAIALLVWIQINLFSWHYGALNGGPIPWSEISIGIIDISFWIFILSLAILKARLFYKWIPHLTSFLFILQAVFASYYTIIPTQEALYKSFTLDTANTYSFSSKQNVIILLLDTFQSDIFHEIIEKDPTHKTNLKGFTYFPDTVGGYATTDASVPLILTGKYYKNEQSLPSFIKENYLQNSLPKILREQGFNISLPANVLNYCDTSICSNYRQRSFGDEIHNLVPLLGLSIFHDLPYFGKEIFYEQYPAFFVSLIAQFGLTNNIDFMHYIDSIAQNNATSPTFKFFHLQGVHQPYTLNEKLQYERMLYTRLNYVRQSEASLKIAENFLLYLQKEGLYDSSMVVILGDHGGGIPSVKRNSSPINDSKFEDVSEVIQRAANPLLLIKKPFSDKDFSSSTVEASLGDVAQTILSTLEISNNLDGYNLFEQSTIPASRARYFRFFTWGEESAKDHLPYYLPTMREFLVQGPISIESSWHSTFHTYSSSSGEEIQLPPPIKLNVPTTFNKSSKIRGYLGKGWDTPEEIGVWSIDYKASLLLPIPNVSSASDYKVSMKVSPFITDSLKRQHITVFANNNLVKETSISTSAIITFSVKKEWITDGNLYLTFSFPDAQAPSGLQLITKSLGFSLQEILVE